MRVALLHYTFHPTIGGVERVIRDQAAALRTLGHTVDLLTREAWDSLVASDGVTSFDAVIVHNVFTMPFDVAWAAELRAAAEFFPAIRWINWVHDVASVNPFYAHIPWAERDYAILSEPYVGVVNVAVSKARQQDYARATGLSLAEIHVIPNGLDLSALMGLTPLVADLRLWERPLVLIHPTRLIRRKNIELGIHVTASLRNAGLEVLYIITGAPDPHQSDGRVYHQELKALVTKLDLDEQVLFLGEVGVLSDEDVRSLYVSADALFFPSTGEGFGLPLLEAMMHRLTIFCSDLPVHHEVLGNGARYFPLQSNPDEISARIMQWHESATINHQRHRLWCRHEMVKICQEHLEPLLSTANQSS